MLMHVAERNNFALFLNSRIASAAFVEREWKQSDFYDALIEMLF